MNANNPIPQTTTKSLGGRLEYRNPLNNLFFNTGYRLSDSKNNLLASSRVNESGFSVIEYIERENNRETNTLYAEIGKYFPKFKTNLSVTFNETETISQQLRNDDFIDNKNTANSLGLKFNNTYFSWMSIDFNVSKSWTKQTNGIQNNKTEGYNHNLNVFFYPLENHTIGFYWDQINSTFVDTQYQNAFYDLSYQFSWASKKIDFELKWMNIANRKVFERIDLNLATVAQTTMLLRPSQVMFTVKFNFK